ncbi:MAG: ribonuclease H-like domain-containing protein [Alphaproteobacteria bacterium]
MNIQLHQGDLPEGALQGPSIAVDTEAMGLKPWRDRLCLVQLSAGDGEVHIVQFFADKPAPNLTKLLSDPSIVKIFHYARFDVALLMHSLGVVTTPIYCTKIASRLVRNYTDRHGLKDLCKDLLGIEISKQEQTSDWGNPELRETQLRYAATDVLHLHALKQKLDVLLVRENRQELAEACFRFLPYRAQFDLWGGGEEADIFRY